MLVKICGITNEKDAEVAINAGADLLGFILHPTSPRFVDPKKVWNFVADLPAAIQHVAVTVNLTPQQILEMAKDCPFDTWQLHGDETEADCATLASLKIIKAVQLKEGWESMVFPTSVSAYLLDTPSATYGGTGKTFNWDLAVQFKAKTDKPVFLSGGLTPENVAKAIQTVQPYAVDVSSGVESSPGRKDHAKLRDFIQICKKQ